MNFLGRSLVGVVRACVRNTIEGSRPSLIKTIENGASQGSILNKFYLGNIWTGFQQLRQRVSLQQLHRRGPYRNPKSKKKPLGGHPFLKGVVIRPVIKKPKKPNSANRKCVIVKLSNGKEMTAHVPGIGHNLQEHNVVLCRVGRLKDTPGVKLKCVRGKYDLPHVIKPTPK